MDNKPQISLQRLNILLGYYPLVGVSYRFVESIKIKLWLQVACKETSRDNDTHNNICLCSPCIKNYASSQHTHSFLVLLASLSLSPSSRCYFMRFLPVSFLLLTASTAVGTHLHCVQTPKFW